MKLANLNTKQNIYSKKKLLNGTGIVIKEDLPKGKLELVNKLTEKLGIKNVWTENGKIHVYHENKIKIVKNKKDIEHFINII